jgi:hypothetical protein
VKVTGIRPPRPAASDAAPPTPAARPAASAGLAATRPECRQSDRRSDADSHLASAKSRIGQRKYGSFWALSRFPPGFSGRYGIVDLCGLTRPNRERSGISVTRAVTMLP